MEHLHSLLKYWELSHMIWISAFFEQLEGVAGIAPYFGKTVVSHR